jgi:low temperature requirement protein LtrA
LQLWTQPILREGEEEERRVDWIELFFDLAFVAVVSALSTGLSRNVHFDGLALYALLFSSMWVVWRYGAIYADRFETDDLSYRVSLLALMAAVAAMAVSAGEGLVAGFRGFGISYAAASVIVMSLWLRGGRHNPSFRGLARGLTTAHLISIVLWVIAVVVGLPVGWWIALAALLVDLSAPLVTAPRQDDLPRLSSTHLPERFGLFIIIVLGEAVLATTLGLSVLRHRSPLEWAAGACALLLITGLYWLYFDQVMSGEPPETALRRNLTQYLHLPLAMSIAAVSAIVPELVELPGQALSTSSRLLFLGGIAAAIMSIALLDAATVRGSGIDCLFRETRLLETLGAAVLLGFALLVPAAPALGSAVLAVAIVVAIIVRGAFVRAKGVC